MMINIFGKARILFFSITINLLEWKVVECHPSVRKCRTKNAVEQESFEKKICNEFKENKYLETITETEKLNIIIYRKYPKRKKRGTVQEVCHEIGRFIKVMVSKNKSSI